MYTDMTIMSDAAQLSVYKDDDKRIVLSDTTTGFYLTLKLDEAKSIVSRIEEAINGESRDWSKYYGKP